MAASVVQPGFGTIIQVGSAVGTAGTYTTIGEIQNISGPSVSRTAIDVSHTESPEGWMEYKPGMADAGEITLDMNLLLGSSAATNSNHVAVVLQPLIQNNPTNSPYIGSNLSRNFKILWPDTAVTALTSSTNKFQVDGFVSGFTPTGPHNDRMSATLTIKCTAKPLFS